MTHQALKLSKAQKTTRSFCLEPPYLRLYLLISQNCQDFVAGMLHRFDSDVHKYIKSHVTATPPPHTHTHTHTHTHSLLTLCSLSLTCEHKFKPKKNSTLLSTNNMIGTFKPNLVPFSLYSKKLFKRWSRPPHKSKRLINPFLTLSLNEYLSLPTTPVKKYTKVYKKPKQKKFQQVLVFC